jgi:2-oxoglutarate ferredoxin oxidoreductase subunit alpha
MNDKSTKVLLEGSLLIIEALAQAGADVFIGYPITPANYLYQHGSKRFPIALAAPDEITTLQWMSGFAASGHIPITATSFPGFALMIESINMAYMMELPLVIVLAQRLGPSTGSATVGAQGDINLVHGAISGGYSLPTLCISNLDDCWALSAEAVKWAVNMRSPVVLLTSKEIAMTHQSYDLSSLPHIGKVIHDQYSGSDKYLSYAPAENLVPPFLPVGNTDHQVRINASTHDKRGILQNSTPESLENTKRLQYKLEKNLDSFTFYELDEEKNANALIVSYGITSQAARDAADILRSQGKKVSCLILKTLFPTPPVYREVMDRYDRIVFAEENLTGQMSSLLMGKGKNQKLRNVNAIGRIITPEEITREVEND